MTNMESLQANLRQNEDKNMELARKNFEAAGTLTEEELKTLDTMRNDAQITAVEQDELGRKSEVSVHQFVSTLEDRIVKTDTTPPVKLMDSFDLPDVMKIQNEMSSKMKTQVMDSISSITGADVDETDFDDLSNRTMDALRKMFHVETLDSEKIVKKLNQMPLDMIVKQLPEDLIHTFCSDEELTYHKAKAKSQLITSLGYLIVTGPQLDDLTDYIDHEHKKMTVMTRLTQCGIDISNTLTSEESIAEIVEKSKNLRSDQSKSYAEILKLPDACFQFFSQFAIISDRTADAYQKLFDEFSDEEDRAMIQEEVDINRKKAETYRSICDLTLFQERAEIYMKSIQTDHRITKEHIERQAMDVIDRLKRAKIPIMFPGYTGSESTSKEVYYRYIELAAGNGKKDLRGFVANYNSAITLLDHYEKDVTELQPITHDAKLFGNCVLVVMGRIAKYLSRNTATKYDAIALDGYFRLLCQMSSDLFIINKMNLILTPIMNYIESLPETRKKR